MFWWRESSLPGGFLRKPGIFVPGRCPLSLWRSWIGATLFCCWETSSWINSADGKATILEVRVYRCTFVGRATRRGKYPRVPKPYGRASCQTSSSRRDSNFREEVSIATRRDCIATSFRSAGKMQRIYLSIKKSREIGRLQGSQRYQIM